MEDGYSPFLFFIFVSLQTPLKEVGDYLARGTLAESDLKGGDLVSQKEELEVLKFEFRLPLKDFKDIINALSVINTPELIFHITVEGIHLRMMDPSHVMMVDFRMKAIDFDEFLCLREGYCIINASELRNVLKLGSGDYVTVKQMSPNYVEVSFEGKRLKKRFRVAILTDRSIEVPPEISIDFNQFARVTVTTESFTEAIKNAAAADFEDENAVTLMISPLAFRVRGERTDIWWDKEDLVVPSEGFGAEKYSIECLENIIKSAPLATYMEVAVGEQNPARFTFELNNGGVITWFLAPRIDA